MKVAQSKEEEENGQKNVQSTVYKDYRDVKGVKMPYNMIRNLAPGVELDIKLDTVTINEGVTDADFQ